MGLFLRMQKNIGEWAHRTFGSTVATHPLERATRILEEALEIAQVEGVDQDRIARLVHHVYGKPVGERHQEIGGLGVTLMAYADSFGLDAFGEIAREYGRISSKEMSIRVNAKHRHKATLGLAMPCPLYEELKHDRREEPAMITGGGGSGRGERFMTTKNDGPGSGGSATTPGAKELLEAGSRAAGRLLGELIKQTYMGKRVPTALLESYPSLMMVVRCEPEWTSKWPYVGDEICRLGRRAERAEAVVAAVEALTGPDRKVLEGVYPGPEREELEKALEAYQKSE